MFLQNSALLNNTSKFLLILLFVYAGSSKLLGHALFVSQLSQVEFLKSFATFISLSLPVLEIVTALFIAFDQTQIAGLWLGSLLMTIFTNYVAGMLISKSSLPCTCGGIISSMSWKQHLGFNIFFMLLSWNALYHYYKQASKDISTNKKEVS